MKDDLLQVIQDELDKYKQLNNQVQSSQEDATSFMSFKSALDFLDHLNQDIASN